MILCIIALVVWVIGMFIIVVIPIIDPPRSRNHTASTRKTEPVDYLARRPNSSPPPKQYVRTYSSSSSVVPSFAEEPYKLHFAYSPSSIEGEDLSDFDKERIALIMSIIDSGVSKYLGFSDKVLVDYNFLPINESSDPSFAKLYQRRCILLNKDLEKYDLQLWVNNSKVVLSVPVDYALSLPQKYEEQVLSYLIVHCGLRIDFA